MIIQSTSRAIEILAPAKVNLFLEVLGKRQDGYHEIDSVLCPIDLFDRVSLEPHASPSIELEVVLPVGGAEADDPAWRIPADDSNLTVRALKLLQAKLGTRQGGCLRLEKAIPAAAGLAGGSSDAAAAVCAALIAWGRWDRELATSVCSALGSDIPFFLGDKRGIGLTRVRGRGEICELLSARPALEFVLTHPPAGCSTPAVYRRFVRMGRIRNSEEIVAACEDGHFQKVGAELFNALQFSASSLSPWIERQLGLFSQSGWEHCLMSGSGSSCFALLERVETRAPGMDRLRSLALAAGISRIYEARAHYSPSIESQL